jgi:AraC-like DNA-binding protein
MGRAEFELNGSNGGQGQALSAFARVSTSDADAAAEQIGRIFCPHALEPLERSWPNFHARHNSAAFDRFSINFVAYGGAVLIDPGCLERFFLLQMPVRGAARVRVGGDDVESAPGLAASLLSPTLPTRMIWRDDCAQFILLLDRKTVEARAAALAETASGAVEFEPAIDLSSPFGRALQGQIDYCVDFAERLGPDRKPPPVAVASLCEATIALLFAGQRSSVSARLDRVAAQAEAPPRAVRRARAYLEAHFAEPFDIERMARVCGVGLRSLQIGFRRYYAASISEVLLDLRLGHLRRRLAEAAPGERVVDIAFEVGFTHPGRMAAAYRARFGESPSATLRTA